MPMVPFLGFFGCALSVGKDTGGPMIPYCPGAPCVVSLPLYCTNDTGQEGINMWGNQMVNCVLFYCEAVCCVSL
ncbi:unnamed protein product [Staurois parvus]|uniref:Secreted protein n=1 Tax=Staurois parvus TaxID=386267 RepID=A0ABN9E1N7_9NEOB|nr:unnamed protein product [Staurois parvus]